MIIQKIVTSASGAMLIKDSQGRIWAMGNNSSGELGTNSTTNISTPSNIVASGATDVLAGGAHVTAIISNSLYLWGKNDQGQLGSNNTTNRSSPVQLTIQAITFPYSWRSIASNGSAMAAIRSDNSSLWTWGYNAFGQLGDGTTTTRSSPVQIGTSSWNSVTAGVSHMAAINALGGLFTWGANTVGQLGANTITATSSPSQVGNYIPSSWRLIVSGNNASHTAAIRSSDGSLFTWGLGTSGQLGDNTNTTRLVPAQILTYTPSSWKSIGAGNQISFFVNYDGSLWAAGYNNLGQLGDQSGGVSKSSPVQIGLSSWSMVTVGYQSAYGITADKKLYAWGDNTSGALGDGTTQNRNSPVQIGSSSWLTVAAGQYNAIGITITGALFTWGAGSNGSGAIGDGTTISKSSPVQIGTSSWTMVAAGGADATNSQVDYGITIDGRLFAWGSGAGGILGDGTTISKSSPVQVAVYPGGVPTFSSFSIVAAGVSHVMAITTAGTLWAWGSNSQGQLGDPAYAFVTRLSPIQIGSNSWSAVSCGDTHTIAIDSLGKLYGMGNNAIGQLGLGDASNRSSPTQIGTGSWVSVSAGLNHSTAIDTQQNLWGWGNNSQGQLGDSTTTPKLSPVQIGLLIFCLPAYKSWTTVSVNDSHTAGITTDGKLYTWGLNNAGQLGLGDTVNRPAPASPASTISPNSWSSVSAGISYTTAITTTGSLYAWGLNSSGQIGNGTTINSSSPVLVTNYANRTWSMISNSSGASHFVAVSAEDKSLWTWGLNNNGQLGDGTTINKSAPVQISSNSWTYVATTISSGAAIDVNGRLYVWGAGNGTGTLGDGTTISKSSPIQIGSSSWSAISGGGNHFNGITLDGRLFAWGTNTSGQLGDGTLVNKSSPVQVGAIYNIASFNIISSGVGASHTAGIDISGKLWTWGLNNAGQIGDGTTINKSSPVQIGTSSWTKVSASDSHVVAIDISGKLYAWGLNSSGQFGDGTTINKSSPVQIGSSSWTIVSAGVLKSAAIDIAGRLFAWGTNTSGELGQNDLVARSSPVQVTLNVTGSSWTKVSVGRDQLASITTTGQLWAWGGNVSGQLGDITTISKSTPIQVPNSVITSWKVVGVGMGAHSLAISGQNSGLYAWGTNTQGQLGDNTVASRSRPFQIGTSSWAAVSMGESHSLAVDIAGNLYGWGANNVGQVGDGTTINKSSPVAIFASVRLSWAQLAVSTFYSHAAAIGSDGSLWTWGVSGSSGQLGDGTTLNRSTPVKIGTSSWVSVSAGGQGMMGITLGGQLYCWGAGTFIPDNQVLARSSPVIISSITTAVLPSQGNFGGVVIDTSSRLFVWGTNLTGNLGDGTTLARSTPVQIAGSWSKVSAGDSFISAIRTDGSLWAWGQNTGGQLGLGDTLNRSSPVQVTLGVTGSSWSAVTAGISSASAITTTGQLWAWGLNSSGQIGDVTTISKSSPIQVPNPAFTSWKVVGLNASQGSQHTMAIRGSDSTLWGWGQGTTGQLGDSTIVSKSNPVQIGTSSWNAVAVGDSHTLAIDAVGRLFAWGYNLRGQLGNGNVTNTSSPVAVTLGVTGSSWSAVAASQFASMAITTDGKLYVWGGNATGILGDGTTIDKSSPVQLGSSSWTAVSVANSSAVAKLLGGTIFAWGFNGNGQLGDGTTANRSSPVQVGSSSWIAISVGGFTTVAIRGDGALFTWGAGGNGHLGDGTTIAKSSPIQIGNSSWSVVAGANGATGAIDITGRLFTWGFNTSGQLGDNTVLSRSSPVQVGSSLWSKLYGGGSRGAGEGDGIGFAALNTSGNLYIWGNNTQGGIGDGTTINKSSPVVLAQLQSSGTYSSWSFVGPGNQVTYAITSAGLLYTWGLNTAGQLGDGTIVSKSYINQLGSSSWTFVAGGSFISGGIINNQIYMWGAGGSGQLGQGNLNSYSSPVFVGSVPTSPLSGVSWSIVSAGGSFSTAITTLGQLYTWGLTTAGLGYLGTGGNTAYVPIQTILGSWSAVSAGTNHALAKQSGGTWYGWGTNTSGQLGDGTTITKSSPIQIGTGSWSVISAGGQFNIAIRASDSSLWTWGNNATYGFLGDGTTINKSSPVQIGTSSWSLASAGNINAIALDITGRLFAWGIGTQGEIGDGSFLNRSSPTQVTYGGAANVSWTLVTGLLGENQGGAAYMAQNSAGNIYTWGLASSGQIGNNLTTVTSGPTILALYTLTGTYSSWSFVGAGTSQTTAIDINSSLYTWGANLAGQLGDGTTTNRSNVNQLGSSSWSFVSGSDSYTTAIDSTGKLFIWGLNASGQLGDGTTINKSSPVQAGIGSSWSQAPAGSSFTAALRTDGTIYAWGLNTVGQLGAFDTISRSNPVIVLAATNIGLFNSWSAVGAGSTFTVAIDSNKKLYAWGDNTNGQLGYGDTTARIFPVQLGASSWTAVAGGFVGSVAGIDITGKLFTWGGNTSGQLGDGTTLNKSSPIQIGASSWTQIGPGGTGFIGITATGGLFLWGANTSGQLGDNTAVSKSSPVQIGSSSWTMVAGGNSMSGAIDITGKLYVWGANSVGQIGDQTVANRSNPVLITAFISAGVSVSSWSAVSAGGTHVIALTSTKSLYSWGTNSSGQLGLGDTVNRSVPVQIDSSSWTIVTAGSSHSLAVKLNNSLWAWGYNNFGQLGDGTTINKSSPVQVTSFNARQQWLMVSVNQVNYALAISSIDRSLWAWGYNTFGQLGDGTTINKSSPVQIGTSSWAFVSAGTVYAAAIDIAGRLFTWGSNNSTLGTNDLINRSSPVQITTGVTGSSWTMVSAGGVSPLAAVGQMLAITTTRQLWAWGTNSTGNLGDGTTIDRSIPVQIGSSSWSIVAGSGAIDINGRLYLWGANTAGQVGDGTTLNRSSPVQVGANLTWSNLVDKTFTSASAAIDSSGRLWTWGYNGLGIGGDGTTINKSSPVLIGSISWSTVNGGGQAIAAITIDGRLFTWGGANNGEIGDGTTINKSSPVQIGSNRSWSSAAMGNNVGAITNDGYLFMWGSAANGGLGDVGASARSSPAFMSATRSVNSSWSILSAGGTHSLGITTTGLLYGWGASASQLGDNSVAGKSTPVQLQPSSWISVTAGSLHSAGVDSTNSAYTWGGNASGQLGDNTVVTKSVPVTLTTVNLLNGYSSWSAVSAGSVNTAAITTAGALFNWGDNSAGEVGDGTTLNRSVPVQVTLGVTGSSWTAVSAGNSFTNATNATRRLFAWGLNSSGQLGQGDTLNKSVPAQVPTYVTRSWRSVVTGGNTYAINAVDGSLWSWGSGNTYGSVGDGTTINKSSPVQIGAQYSTSWTIVSASNAGDTRPGAAIDVAGRLWTWGQNDLGQLGDGTTLNKSVPVLITVAGVSWTAVAVAQRHIIGLTTQNTIYAWGGNVGGALGDGTTINRSSPVQIGSLSNWTAISASLSYSTAINSQGSLYTWGDGTQYTTGQLNDNTNKSSPVIVKVLTTTTSWNYVTCIVDNSYGIKNDGSLWTWGNNTGGQLGDGTTINKSSPIQIGTSSWSMVTGGYRCTTAITTAGELYAWGYNGYGNLGDGTTTDRLSPVKIGSSSWLMVSAGISWVLGITLNGSLYAWGGNQTGFLGDGTVVAKSSPVKIGSSSWSMVSGANYHSAAIDAAGRMFSWGRNANGEIGDGTTISKSSPVLIGSSSWTFVATASGISNNGGDQTFGITIAGQLFAWGVQNNGGVSGGYLGDGTTLNRSSPVQIGSSSWTFVVGDKYGFSGSGLMFGITTDNQLYTWSGSRSSPVALSTVYNGVPPNVSWTQVGVGGHFTIYSSTTKQAYILGNNASGQLGLGNTISSTQLYNVNFDTGLYSSWSAVSAGDSIVVALDSNKTLWNWGFGTGFWSNQAAGIPTQINSSSWTKIAAGWTHASAIDVNGALWAWGINTAGQLGLNDTITRSSPVQIGTSSWSFIGPGSFNTSAIDINGNLYIWGYNGNGQLGDNTTINKSSPVALSIGYTNSGYTSWISVASGGSHTIGVGSTGQLYTWGLNTSGQLGTNTVVNRSYPVQVGLSSWSSVRAGASHSSAIRSDGALFVWGDNTYGQTGDNTVVLKSSPVQIGTRSWSVVSSGAGANMNIGILSDNAPGMYTWGLNNSGQLGTIDVISRSTPVQIGGTVTTGTVTNYILFVAAGLSHTVAIAQFGSTNTLYTWGLNSSGQLGNGSTINAYSPAPMSNYPYASLVYAGGNYTFKR